MNWYYTALTNCWLKMAAQPPQPPLPPNGGQPDPNDGLSDDDIRKMIPKLREDAARDEMKKQPYGNLVKQYHGVWPYPFYKIHPANGEGWVINWFDDPGAIHDINEVNVGDKIADVHLNHTPYWEVTGIDENKGQIFLAPLPNNMWATGIGAGGKKLDDQDRAVASGQYEDDSINRYLQRLQKRQYARPGDVAYILKGTCPVHVGPNGSQGGWYACQDHHARGYQEGLGTPEIIQTDAASLKKLGFDVPAKGLDGTIDPSLWNDYINGQYDDRHPEESKDMLVAGEDHNDPQKLAHFVLNHPEPNVKKRNLERLGRLIDGYAKYRELLDQVFRGTGNDPLYKTKEGEDILDRKTRELDEAYHSGKFGRPDLLPMLKYVLTKMPEMEHRNSSNMGFDAYTSVKETAMFMALKNGWYDLLQKFEASKDMTARQSLIGVYRSAVERGGEAGTQSVQGLLRLEKGETDPENLYDILTSIRRAGVDVQAIVAQNPQKYQRAMSGKAQDGTPEYYAKELISFMRANKLMGMKTTTRPIEDFDGPDSSEYSPRT